MSTGWRPLAPWGVAACVLAVLPLIFTSGAALSIEFCETLGNFSGLKLTIFSIKP